LIKRKRLETLQKDLEPGKDLALAPADAPMTRIKRAELEIIGPVEPARRLRGLGEESPLWPDARKSNTLSH